VTLKAAGPLPGPGLSRPADPGDEPWLTLAWVRALGLLAMRPIGAVLGALFRSVRSAAIVVMLGSMVLSTIAAIEGLGSGFHMVVVHHTDCGLTRLSSPIRSRRFATT
jgi:hypothetical protein